MRCACARATRCGDRACRRREMPVSLRLRACPRDPLRRVRVSEARNAGEIAFVCVLARPSVEIARVGSANAGEISRGRRPRVSEARIKVKLRGRVSSRGPLRRSCASQARSAAQMKLLRLCACILHAALCGDRAYRKHQMQVKLRYRLRLLLRSRVSEEIAFARVLACASSCLRGSRPSPDIARAAFWRQGVGPGSTLRLRLRERTFARCAVGRLRQRLREFFLGSLCYRGAAASGQREFTLARCAVGRLRERLREFFLGSQCEGCLKWSETAISANLITFACCAVGRLHDLREFFPCAPLCYFTPACYKRVITQL